MLRNSDIRLTRQRPFSTRSFLAFLPLSSITSLEYLSSGVFVYAEGIRMELSNTPSSNDPQLYSESNLVVQTLPFSLSDPSRPQPQGLILHLSIRARIVGLQTRLPNVEL